MLTSASVAITSGAFTSTLLISEAAERYLDSHELSPLARSWINRIPGLVDGNGEVLTVSGPDRNSHSGVSVVVAVS